MATKRLPMRQVRQILRLKFQGLPHRQIARACSVSISTVSDYLQRAAAAGLSWPLPAELDDAVLEAKLFKAPAPPSNPRPSPDLAWVHRELRRPGVTLQLLWHEYLEEHPDGYRYTQFCERYRRFRRKLSPTMRQVHRAGHKIFVDYSGKRPSVVDRGSGDARPVELFVGVLGASSYVYAEATVGQDLASWIGSHVRMFEYFGGCAEILVPDNLKSGVTRACRYEPAVNRTYAEMAEHYGAAVIPARAGKPRDKAKVESSVLLAQRWILAVLRNRTFFSLAELNGAIRERLEVINDKPMQQLGASRRELYERLDRPLLQPLPSAAYEMAEWNRCTVNIDYHVQVAGNWYSVPYQLVHQQVEARFTDRTVELYFKGNRVGGHLRLVGKGKHVTCAEHMPASHRAHAQWTPSRLIGWAERTGPATARVVVQIMTTFPHPEQGYRSCLGIMRLSKRYGPERLEAASERAETLGSCRYGTIKNILSSGLDRQPAQQQQAPTVPVHKNIRGANYYAESSSC